MITILRQLVARKFGSIPLRSRSQHDLAAKSCPAHNFFICSQILKQFTEMITILRRRVMCNILAATLQVKVTAWHFSKNVLAHNINWRDFVIWSQILQLFYIIDHHIDTMCRAQHFWRSRSHHDFSAYLCPAHNFVIWSPFLKFISHKWSPC